MSKTTTTETQNRLFSEADDLSFKLGGLLNIVKLAAFATEARRTLNSFDALARVLPEVEDNILKFVSSPTHWKHMDDNAGEVLEHIANELESTRDELDATLPELKRETAGSAGGKTIERACHAI
ncbi:MAG: hypothetical protein I8H70_02485 [Burkholderiales bacterium]|nr:hypothetical protein [Burkholderiales bacterium]